MAFLRRLPYVTIVLMLSSFGFYILPNRPALLVRLALDPSVRLAGVLLHPILHTNITHLIGNTVLGIAIVGTLIETWMIQLRRLFRYGILFWCYLVSLGVAYLAWLRLTGTGAFGLSGVVSAAVPFTLFYYLTFSDRIDLVGLSVFAPIGVGFLIAALVLPIASGVTESGYTLVNESSMFHLLAALPSFVAALLLFLRIRK